MCNVVDADDVLDPEGYSLLERDAHATVIASIPYIYVSPQGGILKVSVRLDAKQVLIIPKVDVNLGKVVETGETDSLMSKVKREYKEMEKKSDKRKSDDDVEKESEKRQKISGAKQDEADTRVASRSPECEESEAASVVGDEKIHVDLPGGSADRPS